MKYTIISVKMALRGSKANKNQHWCESPGLKYMKPDFTGFLVIDWH